MRPLFVPPLNSRVRHKPGVAATAPILTRGVGPARDVALVLVRHTEGETIERSFSLGRKVKNIFVAIVQVTGRVDRLEMAARNLAPPELVRQGNRLDPVNRVLQNEKFAQAQDQLVRQHRIGRRSTEVEKKRSVRLEKAANLGGPLFAPIEIQIAFRCVREFAVPNPEIVRRRRNDEIDRTGREPGHPRDAVA